MNDEPNTRQNAASERETTVSRVFLCSFDDGIEVVVRARCYANARALAYRARADDKGSPRIVNVEAKEIGAPVGNSAQPADSYRNRYPVEDRLVTRDETRER